MAHKNIHIVCFLHTRFALQNIHPVCIDVLLPLSMHHLFSSLFMGHRLFASRPRIRTYQNLHIHRCVTTACSLRSTQDYIVQRLLAINGIKIAVPEGAFYVLPDMSAFFGPGVSAEGFGEVPDSDALCRYFIEVARVSAPPPLPLRLNCHFNPHRPFSCYTSACVDL